MRNMVLVLIFLATAMDAQVRIEKTAFQGWPNCYRMTNGTAELIVTSDIGPRVMRYGFAGGQNFLMVDPAGAGKSGEPDWQIRGGHRVWVAPEDRVYTYPPDNSPVDIKIDGATLTATQPVEKATQLEKQLVIKMDASGSGVTIVHRITNKGVFPLEFSAWALSMMTPGGHGITGYPPRGTHQENLQPTNPLVMWAYTYLNDSRWTFTQKYLVLRQDPKRADPQKLGALNRKTWGAYFLNGEIFVKQADADPARLYPDFNCSFEMFTNDKFLELETLGPLTKVAPGATLEHTERWQLQKNVSIPEWTDAALDRVLLPLLGR